jgi:acyl-CoA reductase-like NAD-dependent aldehyde dehydrogenase
MGWRGTDATRSCITIGIRATSGSRARVEQAEALARHVEESVAAGVAVLTGGKPQAERAFFPTDRARRRHRGHGLLGGETFGPVAVVIRAADDDIS